MKKMIITDAEPEFNADSDALAKVITSRMGLLPRKQGSTDSMHKVLLELYEKSKQAGREKTPELAVMTVEQMAIFAGISKQTMYEYLERWVDIEFITKATFVGSDHKVVKGYKLNGTTLEEAYRKVQSVIMNNLSQTATYVSELQKMIKNEKIRDSMKKEKEEENHTV